MVHAGTPTISPHLDDLTSRENPPGQIVLRIRGTSRDGQVVRLASPKCTIGAHPLCTLRLNARGVQPVHCLIIRGPKQTVIRRWSPDTLLNGRTFSDSPLCPGDELSVGPIRFEVLQTTETTSPTQVPTASKSKDSSETGYFANQLANQLDLANRQGRRRARWAIGQLRQARLEVTHLRDRLRKSDGQRGTQKEDDARQAKQEQDKRELDAQRKELDAQRVQIEGQRREWEAAQQKAQREMEAHHKRLATQHAELEQAQARWRQQQDAVRSDVVRTTEQSETQRREWQSRHEEFERDQDRWRQDREAEAARLQQRQTELDAREAQTETQWQELGARMREFQTLRTELDKQRAAFEEVRTRWLADRDSAPASAAKASQAAAERIELDGRLRQFEQDRERLRTEHQEQDERLKQRRAELDAREAQFEKQRNELDAQRSQHDQHRRESAAQQKAFETAQQEWDAQRQASEAELAERKEALAARETTLSEREAALAVSEAELARHAEQLRADEAAAASRPSKSGPPVDASSVLSRLGVTLPPDDEEDAEPASANLRESALPAKRTSSAEVSRKGSSGGEPAARSSASEHEDESIEDYMARLMKRVRSAATEPDEPQPTPTAKPSRPAGPATSSAETEDHASRSAAKKARRPAEPVHPNQIEAMRRLASATATSAIDQHAIRMLRRSTHEKIAIAALAAACGAGLLTAWTMFALHNVIYYAGLVCILVAVAWGIQYVILTGRLVVKKKRRKSLFGSNGDSPSWNVSPSASPSVPPSSTDPASGQEPSGTDE